MKVLNFWIHFHNLSIPPRWIQDIFMYNYLWTTLSLVFLTATYIEHQCRFFFCSISAIWAFICAFSALRTSNSHSSLLFTTELTLTTVSSTTGTAARWQSLSIWPYPPYRLQYMTLGILLKLALDIFFRFTLHWTWRWPLLLHLKQWILLAGLCFWEINFLKLSSETFNFWQREELIKRKWAWLVKTKWAWLVKGSELGWSSGSDCGWSRQS